MKTIVFKKCKYCGRKDTCFKELVGKTKKDGYRIKCVFLTGMGNKLAEKLNP